MDTGVKSLLVYIHILRELRLQAHRCGLSDALRTLFHLQSEE